MNNISLSLSKEDINRLVSSFDHYQIKYNVGNIAIQIKADDCCINIYKTNKVVFTGRNAQYYSSSFIKESDFICHCGSDEVGTGDYFGPICVCGCYIDQQVYDKLKQYHFDDSKKLSDSYILQIIDKVIDIVPHSLLILDNKKYNQINKDNNLNMIKAKMHNQVYLNLIKKGIALPELIVIDDFCGEDKYYQYLENTTNVVKNITFETKAESKYLAVSIASMIARYAFLKYMNQLNERYDVKFPLGATNVDEFAQKFVDKYGKDELLNVAKINFKNTQRLH